MPVLRLALSALVLGASILLGLWAAGVVGGAEVSDATPRLLAIVAIGGGAATAVFALLGGRRSPPPANPPANGPRF